MKVQWLHTSINQFGGVERVIIGLSNYFVNNGIETTVTSLFSDETEVHFPYDERIRFEHLHKNVKDFKKTDYLKVLGQILRQSDADVVICCHEYINASVALLKKQFHGKTVITQHITSNCYTSLHFRINSILYKRADAFLVLTEYDKAVYEKKRVRNCAVMPNAVFDPREERSSLTNHEIIAAGRFVRIKGFDILIRAFSLISSYHPDWVLRLLGDGDEMESLRSLTTELSMDGKVIFEGFQTNVTDYMVNSGIFALPSLNEGFPIVMLEAMGCGLPIISSDLPSTRDALKDGAGLMVESGNVEALADALNKMMSSESLRKQYADAAYEKSFDYSLSTIGQKWIELFDSLQ